MRYPVFLSILSKLNTLTLCFLSLISIHAPSHMVSMHLVLCMGFVNRTKEFRGIVLFNIIYSLFFLFTICILLTEIQLVLLYNCYRWHETQYIHFPVALNIFWLIFHHAVFQTFQLLHENFQHMENMVLQKIFILYLRQFQQLLPMISLVSDISSMLSILHCSIWKQIADFILFHQ